MRPWKCAIAIGFAAFVQCGLNGAAIADDDHRHGRWHGDRGHYEHHDRHWRPHYYTREYYYGPPPVVYYAPPPVYVVPPRPPSVGFNLIFPFRFD
jgi:hypothetical protein